MDETPDLPTISTPPMREDQSVPAPPKAAPELPPEVRAALDKAQQAQTREPTAPPEPPDTIELPGFKVTLRPASQLRAKHTKQAVEALDLRGKWGWADALMPHVIESWNATDENGKKLKLPSEDPAVVDELTTEQYRELGMAMWLYFPTLMPAMWAKFTESEDIHDPDSPTSAPADSGS